MSTNRFREQRQARPKAPQGKGERKSTKRAKTIDTLTVYNLVL
jgi:hypothetical protein